MAHVAHEYGYVDAAALKAAVDGVTEQLTEFHKANAAALTPDTASAFIYFRHVVEQIVTAHTTGSAYARAIHAYESLNHFTRQAARDHIAFRHPTTLDTTTHALAETIPNMLTRAEAFGISRINDPDATTLNIRFSQLLAHNPFAVMPGTTPGHMPPTDASIAQTRKAFSALEAARTDQRISPAQQLYAARHALAMATEIARVIANPTLTTMRDVLIHHTRRIAMQFSEKHPELARLDTAALAAEAGITPDAIDLAPHLQAHAPRSAMQQSF